MMSVCKLILPGQGEINFPDLDRLPTHSLYSGYSLFLSLCLP